MADQWRARREPRASIIPLARYIESSSPSARQRIIEDLKSPSACRVPYYRHAEIVIQKLMLSAGTATEYVAQAVQRLSAPSSTTWQQQTRGNSVTAIHRFQQIVTQLDFGDQRAATTGRTIIVEGLQLSVRPELILSRTRVDGPAEIGAIKLYFSKDHPLTTDLASNIAVGAQMYLETLYPRFAIGRKLIQVVDVFAGGVSVAPEHQKNRRREIGAACREILARWDSPRAAA